MAKQPPSLSMSQIIAADAPLLSPVQGDHQWDVQQPLFSPTADYTPYGYYNLPPSPPDSTISHRSNSPAPHHRMLKLRVDTNQHQETDQLCLPTHQLFNLADARPLTPPSRSPSIIEEMHRPSANHDDDEGSHAGSKRSASPSSAPPRKRAVGERISTKDFVPPDVTGLSKREARLVKNRAAAFLSRQRKREEFETMEVRVAELEQENARLLALTQNGASASSTPPSDSQMASELEQLRAQLAAAQERERSLSAQLASSNTRDAPIKLESTEPAFLSSPPRPSNPPPNPNKSGASLGLMVLLCALPSLLSMRVQSTAPTSFSIPNPFPASNNAFDYSNVFPNDYDWSKPSSASLMDLDAPHFTSTGSSVKKLEFADTESLGLGNLGDLDIAFDASPSDDGKIRVRILPSSPSSRSSNSGPSALPKSGPSASSAMAMWTASSSDPHHSSNTHRSSFSSPSALPSDPFLGVSSSAFDLPYAADGSMNFMNDLASSLNYGAHQDSTSSGFGMGPEFSIPDHSGNTRRVRIALKSMPSAGGEGGEWEVQLC